MKNVQSYNKELEIATLQFKDVFNNIKIFRYNKDKVATKEIIVPIRYAGRSISLKEIENRKKNFNPPFIAYNRSSFIIDPDRVFNIHREILLTQGSEPDYTQNQPIPVDIGFEVNIFTMYPTDDDQILQNFIPFSMPNFYTASKHPYTDEVLKHQVIWSGDVSHEYPVDYDSASRPRLVTTTSFIYKTWLFPGSALTEDNDRPGSPGNCDVIRKVITEWYDSADAYELLEQGIDIVHDTITYSTFPTPLYARPKEFEISTPTNISVFGTLFNENMKIYLTATDESLGIEDPIIIDEVESGLTGILTDYTLINDEKFILEGISSPVRTELDIIIVSECGNIEKLSDAQGYKILIREESVMPPGDHFMATFAMNGAFELPLVDGKSYDAVIDWGDGSPLEIIDSSTAVHTYDQGEYMITLGGIVPALSFDLKPSGASKLIRVNNMGDELTSINGMFSNCTNLTTVSGIAPAVSNMARVFNRCFALTSFDYTTWNFSNVTTMSDFFGSVELDYTYYSDFVIWMSNNISQTDIVFSGGYSQYSIDATVPRFKMIQDKNWTITDGGFYGEKYQPEYETFVNDTQIRLPLRPDKTYSFVIDWGDGSDLVIIEDPNDIEIFHTYALAGVYTIEIQGLFESWRDSIANIAVSFEILYHVYDSLELTLSLSPDGVYDFNVDWGDGSPINHITEWDDIENIHVYAQPNDYYVTISGICSKWLNKEVLIREPFVQTYNITPEDLFVELPLFQGFIYDFDVDWGDGTTDYIDSWDDPDKLHEYSRAGQYIVSISGLCEKLRVLTERLISVHMNENGNLNLIMDENTEFDAYRFDVNWDDGSSSNISSWDDPDRIHSYVTANTYDLVLLGDMDIIEVNQSYSFDVTATVDYVNAFLNMNSAGEYNYTVDWGDGDSAIITDPDDDIRRHQYDSAGNYTIDVIGVINDTLEVEAVDPLLFNITTTFDTEEAELIMDNVGDYDYTVDWGDGSPTQQITSYNDPNRFHNYAVTDDYVITTYGLIAELSVRLESDVVIPDVIGLISFADDYVDTGFLPITGDEFEIDVKMLNANPPDTYKRSYMGSYSSNGTSIYEMFRFSDGNFGFAIGSSFVALDFVGHDFDRHIWSKDGLNLSISDIGTKVMANTNYDSDSSIYIMKWNSSASDRFVDGILYSYKYWLDEDRLFPGCNYIPVRKNSIQYSNTPAPSNCFWDTVTETYKESSFGRFGVVVTDERTEWEAPVIGLQPTSNTYLDTGIHLNQDFDWELDFRYTGDLTSSFGMMGYANYTSPQDVTELIRLDIDTGRFGQKYGNNGTATGPYVDIGPIDQDRHIIGKRGDTGFMTGFPDYTISNTQKSTKNIYLWAINSSESPIYYNNSEIFSFRVWSNVTRTELILELLPVASGSLEYSNIPAPSNCFWDTVNERYIEANGDVLRLV